MPATTVKLAEALSSIPADVKAQLRLRPHWETGDPDIVLVVCTWDPLAWQRPTRAAVTVHDDASGFGAVVDVPFLLLHRVIDPPDVVLGNLAASARALVDAATRAVEAAPGGRADALTELLHGAPTGPRPHPTAWSAEDAWTDMAAATVLRFVEHEHGSSGIDAEPRPLEPPTTDPQPGCGACAGTAYEIPFELDLRRPGFCPPHRAHALAEIARICSLANETNEDAFHAYGHAMGDLFARPHLPYDVRADARLLVEDAEDASVEEAIIALAGWAEGSRERWIDGLLDLGAYDIDTRDSFEADSTVFNTIYRAGARGDLEMAMELVDLVVPYYGTRAAHLHGELAVQLAEHDQTEDAEARIAAALNLAADPLTLIMAGNVAGATGRFDYARHWYERALAEARALDDVDLEHESLFHLEETARDLGDEQAARRHARTRARVAKRLRPQHRTLTQDTFTHAEHQEYGRKVARNEPCPCGSGRKFKRCHGG